MRPPLTEVMLSFAYALNAFANEHKLTAHNINKLCTDDEIESWDMCINPTRGRRLVDQLLDL